MVKNSVVAVSQLEPFSIESFKQFSAEQAAMMEAREQVFRDAAKRVFDAYIQYPADNPVLDFYVDTRTGKIHLRNTMGDALNVSIAENLNHRSIAYFAELILEHHESARQAARAIKRHDENRAMKADTFVWLDANRDQYKSMDAAAQAITKQQPIAFRTARAWVGDWRKLRSASKP